MKLLVKLLLFMILLCPINTFALVSWNDISNLLSNYTVDYNKDKLYILNSNGKFKYELLTKDEFMIESSHGGSYLINTGLEFWTSTPAENAKYYVIRETLRSKSSSSKSNVRVVATLKENVMISGNGTLTNPWYFPDLIEISFKINNNFNSDSWLSNISCNQSESNKRDNITVYYTPGGKDVPVYFCASDGFVPNILSCDLSASQLVLDNANQNRYMISNINKNSPDKLSCLIDFQPES